MQVVSVKPWKDQVSPMAWRNGRIHYWKSGTGVIAEGFSALPDGSDERPETANAQYPAGTHQAIGDVSQDGRFALVTVERDVSTGGISKGAQPAVPGSGVNNDLWLLDLTTGETWKLVDLLVTGGTALIWPRFDSTGTRVVWAEKWAWWTGPLDSWDLHVADIVWAGNTPMLTNKTVRRSNGFVEPYAFIEGGSAILAANDEWVGRDESNTQIVKVPIDPSKSVVRLSPSVWNEGWPWPFNWFANYNEFAFTMPAYPDMFMFGRLYQADNGSIEYWTMPKSGGNAERLTFFSKAGHPQYQGKTCILGGSAWNPDNPKQFVAAYGTDLNNNYKSVMVTID